MAFVDEGGGVHVGRETQSFSFISFALYELKGPENAAYASPKQPGVSSCVCVHLSSRVSCELVSELAGVQVTSLRRGLPDSRHVTLLGSCLSNGHDPLGLPLLFSA